MTIDLYTPTDVKKCREVLLKEQDGKDAITGLGIPQGKACLDHVHDSEQLVRAVLHRQVNTMLGKIENSWVRMLAWWYPNDLPTFLEQSAKYLREHPKKARYRHPKWLDKVKTQFNQLKSTQQDSVLLLLGCAPGKNLEDRKEKFSNIILDRSLGFDTISLVINTTKEK